MDREELARSRLQRFEDQALEYLGVLYRAAWLITGEDAPAEALVRETYVETFRRYEEGTTEAEVQVDLLRGLLRTHAGEFPKSGATGAEVVWETLPDGTPHLFEIFFGREDLQRLVRHLPFPERFALILSDLLALPDHVVIDILETTPETFYPLLQGARRRLKRDLVALARQQEILE
jgi:DNA-directed RNA polymerase specialized sigma24 family protein